MPPSPRPPPSPPPSRLSCRRGRAPARLSVSTNCYCCPTGGKLALITSSPQRMRDTATYIKPPRSQHAAGVFMRYFTLYGAHGRTRGVCVCGGGGPANSIQLLFRVAKAKTRMQTTGIWTGSTAVGKKSDKLLEGFGQMHQRCHRLEDNRK